MKSYRHKISIMFMIFAIVFAQLCQIAHAYDSEDISKYNHGNDLFYQAASVLVMCAQTGEVFYETEGFTLRYPASITKVMTALLVLEYVQDLEECVFFSHHAVDIPGYASRMGMLEGESISVLEALYGIMLPSGNEVARALAEHVSGSVPAFVERMNQRAIELGAYYTRFVNPCGLPGYGQYVTAYDVALIMQAAIQYPVFLEIISTAYFELPPTELHEEPRRLRNTNRMVRPDELEFNPHVIGGKTGFTFAAQHTLVSYVRNGEIGLIISVLYAPLGATFTDTAILMDYVFAMLAEPEPQEIEPQEPEPQEIEPTTTLPTTTTTEPITMPETTVLAAATPDPPHSQENIYPITQNDEISTEEALVVASATLGIVFLGLISVFGYQRIKTK